MRGRTVKGDAGKKKAGPGSEEGSEQDGWNDGWDGSDDGGFEPFDEPPASPKLPASTAPGASTPVKTDDDISAMSKLTKANEKLAATVSKLESKLADAERARDDAEAEANAAADELAELQKEVNAAPGTPSRSRTATSHDDPTRSPLERSRRQSRTRTSSPPTRRSRTSWRPCGLRLSPRG